MIKVSVLYPAGAETKFDIDYYCTKHMPMAKARFGAACKGMSIDQGLGSETPGAPPAFAAMGHFLFDSIPAFQAAFGPHAKEILGDIPNYTNVKPVIQISDVKL